jgi:hypothetical protein
VSPTFQQVLQSKDAERRRLRDLPWTEKLEMLDRLRDRHLLLRRMAPSDTPRSEAILGNG